MFFKINVNICVARQEVAVCDDVHVAVIVKEA